VGLHPAFTQNTVAWPVAGSHALSFGPSDLDLTIRRGSLQVSSRDMRVISPLPEASAELAIPPTEPLAPPRPSAWNRKWTAAIVVSCLLHAAVAAAFLISPSGTFDSRDAMQSEGSDQSGTNVVGSALDRDPAVMNVTLVPAPQPAKPEPAKAARPAPPTEPSESTREATKQPPKPLPELVKQPTVTPDILVAGAPRPDDQSVAPKTETPTQSPVQAESPKAPAAVPEQPPIPSARPSPAAAPLKAAGEKRGTADGQDRLAQAASKGKKQKEAGSAAEDSYRGDVIRKLSRVNRGVPPSVQATARNNAVVTFVIGSRGGIDELRILQSSGSANFDQVVLGIVRKAAPFPPIPPKVGNSLVFTGAIGPF
jgi:protein TonB